VKRGARLVEGRIGEMLMVPKELGGTSLSEGGALVLEWQRPSYERISRRRRAREE
jgi:hypothetical protein